ncbi:molybdopterin biosynthesis protein [Clostridium thermobutyricum]|uniref:Molybdopterin molybdenumtransferase n=1 Tax=Clostridium thermobutyricum DSM 4928 TaxID=1121339 RepID=A0A1V4STE6_9CLOT|nr:molybdopterin biosynthesis protein [Clostridium thermobutyricum]OPX47149.1 molybdopterin molybdenumtransferase [Clostridium thermobutyricum DSM 4928]
MRNVYIENKDPKEALALYLENLDIKASTEEISLRNALNRISSEPIFSKISSPQNHLAAMDGICVNSSITSLASEINPLKLYENKDFIYVNTGNVIPDRFDSVIMIEDVLERDGFIEIISPSKPWQHIRPIGEDIVKGEMVIPSNYKIDSFALGSLAASGNFKVKVYKNPTVSILVTGSEIVSSLENANKGTIIDSNSYMLSGLVSEFGGNPIIYEPIPDIYESIKSEIISAVKKSDIVIINAGSSAGTHDYTVHIIRELGKVFTHGVALKPGKPTILGEIEDTPVIGIPGYPVSAYVSFKEFVVPVINSFLNKNISYQNKIEGILTKKIPSSFKYRELVRVNTGIVNNKIIATPIARGAGITTSLLKADGIIEIDRSLEGLNTGDKVEISLLKPIEKIKENILSIGSHDILMDILRDFIPITSSHVGSLGGIMALKQNQCHLAPIHLLDSKTGEYNISYVKQYFKEPMVLIKGVKRIQGFMVKKGNPKNITSIKDLTNPNIKFVNRQRGAGTRILLDFLLSQNNISKDQIIGYEREMLTHMSVAAEVNSNKVDVGLGVYSAAKEMNLDFIPVGNEEYDFLIKKSSLEFLSPFIKALKSKEFKAALENLGGYEFTNSGELIYINEH